PALPILDLQRELAPQLPTVPEEAAEAAFYKMVAPVRVDSDRGTRSGRVGQWHALVPSLMHSAVGAVMSSAASSGISMAGRNPGQMRFFGATTERDWSRRPEDTELSATSIPVTDLVAAVNKGATQDVALEDRKSTRLN